MDQNELNLRQKRWLELIKDCDCVIDYHPVRPMLWQMFFVRSLLVFLLKFERFRHFLQNELRSWPVELMIDRNNPFVAHLKVKPIHLDKIRETKNNDPMMVKLKNCIDF